MTPPARRNPVYARLAVLGLAVAALSVMVADAQIEGPERGVRPVSSSGDYAVNGVMVNVTGKNAEDARQNGWQEAQRKAWSMLWARTHGGGGASLPDGTLDGIVTAIVVENEQVGPRRYIARLGVLFDRPRAGQILGISGNVVRSAPMLVIPVSIEAGAETVFEQRTEWQKAWARFRTVESRIDYVRPTGAGAESLVVNAGQTGRRNREWWRFILDQFGAADIVVPIVRIERQWPGGPIVGHFAARYGPDNRYIGAFTLNARNDDGLAAMMDDGVRRMDQLYAGALAQGLLRPDSSLIIEAPVDPDVVKPDDVPAAVDGTTIDALPIPDISRALATTVTVQFDTPDAASVDRGEGLLRGIPGVQGATTTSLALGGVSVMRVQYAGDIATLRAALFARGWQVAQVGEGLRIRREGQ